VLSPVELKSRYLIYIEKYIKDLEIEAKCLNNICMSQVIPTATVYQNILAQAITAAKGALGGAAVTGAQQNILKTCLDLVNNIYSACNVILDEVQAASVIHDEAKKAEKLCLDVKTKMDELREYVDALEGLVDDELWPMPKFWEMLFIS
jgi:glutamine synthetase